MSTPQAQQNPTLSDTWQLLPQDSLEINPPSSLDDLEFLLKTKLYKELINKGIVQTLIIPDWPQQSERLNQWLYLVKNILSFLQMDQVFEYHDCVTGFELLSEVSTWGVKNLIYTIGAQTYSQQQITDNIDAALKLGATQLLVVSGSSPKRRVFEIIIDLLRSLSVTIFSLFISRYMASRLKSKYIPLDVMDILRIIKYYKKNNKLDENLKIIAAINPYKDSLLRANGKKAQGVDGFISQMPLLWEPFSNWWQAAYQYTALKNNITIGYLPIKTVGAVKFMYLLLGITLPLFWMPGCRFKTTLMKAAKLFPGATASKQALKQYEALHNDKKKLPLWNSQLISKIRNLYPGAGIHFMPTGSWEMLAGKAWFHLQTRAIIESLGKKNIRIDYAENLLTQYKSLRACLRVLNGINVLIETDTINVQLLKDYVRKITLLHSIKSNTFQPALQLRSVERCDQFEIIIDVRQLKNTTLKVFGQLFADKINKHANDSDHNIIIRSAERMSESVILWPFNYIFWRNLLGFQQAFDVDFDASIGESLDADIRFVKFLAKKFLTQLKALFEAEGIQSVYYWEGGTAGAKYVKLFIQCMLELASTFDMDPKLIRDNVIYMLDDYSEAVIRKAQGEMGNRFKGVRVEYSCDPNTIAFNKYQGKVLVSHSTNVYDNLKVDRLARINGQYYWIKQKLFIPRSTIHQIALKFGLVEEQLIKDIQGSLLFDGNVDQFLAIYQEMYARKWTARPSIWQLMCAGQFQQLHFELKFLGKQKYKFFHFWQALWEGMQFEESLAAIQNIEREPILSFVKHSGLVIQTALNDVAGDIEIVIPTQAIEKGFKALDALHKKGKLEITDIVVNQLNEYIQTPRKRLAQSYDGSLVFWFNAAIFAAFAKQRYAHFNLVTQNLEQFGKGHMSLLEMTKSHPQCDLDQKPTNLGRD